MNNQLVAALSAALVLTAPALAQGVERPAVIDFTANVMLMETVLGDYCDAQSTRETEPFLPAHAKQQQIDCEGFDYFGAPRKAEFVFGDDKLFMVWILTTRDDEAPLEAAFRQTFGEPSHVSPDFTAFADHRAAVRKDTPEALYYSDDVADAYRGWFDSQVAAQQ